MKYRDRQEIEAVKVTPTGDAEERPDWLKIAIARGTVYWSGEFYTVELLGCFKRARIGDWIVRYGNGDLDTVRSDIFEAMYEPVP